MDNPINICQCGVQDGYPHKPDCPYPYYGNNMDEIKKWLKAWESKKKMNKLLGRKRN